GSGYADYANASGDFVEFAYDAPAAGTYWLTFRYANGGGSDPPPREKRTCRSPTGGAWAGPLEMKVKGVSVRTLSFAPTGSWSTWATAATLVALRAGRNTVRLPASGRSGPNLDALMVRPARADVAYLAQARSISGGLRE